MKKSNSTISTLAAFQANPPRTNFDMQEYGEEIKMLLRQHWFVFLPRILMIIGFLILPPLLFILLLGFQADITKFLPLRFQAVGIFIWYMICLGFSFETFLKWYFNVYIITDRRIIDVDFWGLLYKVVSECSWDKVQDSTYEVKGIFETMFNFGDVYVQTAAEVTRFEFLAVPHPDWVHDLITDLAQQNQNFHKY